MKTKLIANIIYPVYTKKGLKYEKKKRVIEQLPPLNYEKPGKVLDGFILLYSCRVKFPVEAIRSKLSGQNFVEVIEEDLGYFQNLTYLDLSDNKIRIEQLANLYNLVELNLQFNSMKSLLLTQDMFPVLEKLHLSYNNIPVSHLINLKHLKNL